jgi:hypothetical protein
MIRLVYAHTHNAKHKFKEVSSKAETSQLMDIEVDLWQGNDLRTYMYTSTEFLKIDNTKVKVNMPVLHIAAKADHFLDNKLIEKNMRHIFSDFTAFVTDQSTHAPSVIADEKTAAAFIPEKLQLLLIKI